MELIGTGDDSAKGRLCIIASLLDEKTDRLKQLDADILKLCVVDDIEREIEESEEIFSRVSDVRREITKFTSRQNDKPAKTPVVTEVAQENPTITATHRETVEETNINDVSIGGMSTNSSQNSSSGKNTPSFSRSKLPKLILPKFEGDITNYRTFLGDL